jgi:drug/metabolite transporter (DMT)-like permease
MKRSLIELHTAVLIMGGTGLFAKMITLPASDIIALRCVVASLALLAFVKATGSRLGLMNRTDVGWIIAMGVIIAVHWVSFFTSIQLSSVAIGVIAIFTYPVMTALMEPLFFPEPIDRRNLAVAVLVFAAIYLAVPDGAIGSRTGLGAAFGLFAAFLYSLRNILYRKHLKHYPSSTIMFYQVAIAAAVLIPFLSPGIDLFIDYRWVYLIALGVIFTAVSHTLYVQGLQAIRASTVGLISCLEPIYGMILAAVFLAETPGVKTVAGGLIVVAAAIYTSVRVNREGE